MIAEYGALEDPNLPGRKAGWYDQMRSTVKTTYPLVQAVIAWSTENTKNGQRLQLERRQHDDLVQRVERHGQRSVLFNPLRGCD